MPLYRGSYQQAGLVDISVLMQFTKSFEYMAQVDGSFSIVDWLESGKG
jgi:hypothetical protein